MIAFEDTANCAARIAVVQPGSAAARAKLKAGMVISRVAGQPLRDYIDWQWLSSEEEVELEVSQFGSVTLRRTPGTTWGIEFCEPVFDGVRTCKNDCCFCFMKMLPAGMRASLYLRDDDYRLSFLQGNFVTLTNVSDADVERIISYRLSPLSVSLHAVEPSVREQLMGRNHARGLEVLERLLLAGIEIHAQIVLLPGINDGQQLNRSLDWLARRPGVTVTGIVPYGYTQYASLHDNFSQEQCRELCQQLTGLAPRVQLADEFFLRAWPDAALAHIPAESYYAGFPLLEDGIGMVRQFASAFLPEVLGANQPLAAPLFAVTGEAFAPILRSLFAGDSQTASRIEVVTIQNRFFGGNVRVAGLLTAVDVIEQLRPRLNRASSNNQASYRVQTNGLRHVLLPKNMFNDGGLTLDGKNINDIAQALCCKVSLTS